MPPPALDTPPTTLPLEQPSHSARVSRARLLEGSVGVAVALVTVAVYSPCFSYPFVDFDDGAYGGRNPHVAAGLTAEGVRWAFTTFENCNWHPLTWLSLQLDATLFGGQNAGAFHRTNVLLHAANALLLFLVLGRMTGAVWRSAFVAALFALHPLHVESVAWVSERKDTLSTLFWMLALAAYLAYVRRPGVGRYLLVAVALVLGLLAKPMLVTLPCVLLLLDWWPLRRWRPGPVAAASAVSLPPAAPWGRLLLEKVPLFGLVLASCVLTFLAQSRGDAVRSFESYPLDVRVWNALLAYVAYPGKALWPARLAVYYPHPGAAVSVARALAAGLLLAAVTALALGPGRRRPYLVVGWLWYLGTLVPVIGLIQVGGQAMADRYTYVPLIGLFLLFTWGAADLATAWRLPRPYLAAAAAAVLSACVVLTWAQEGSWQSSRHLWEHAVRVTENNLLAHMNLGACYHERGMHFDSRKEFEKAVAVDPGAAAPHYNLGIALAELGKWEAAAAEFRRAIDLGLELVEPHNELGLALMELGRPEAAAAEFRRAVDLDPGRAAPHTNLARALQKLGRPEEAAAEYRKALELGDERARAGAPKSVVQNP
jgi:protein O-mannosyl-transferase